MKYFAIEKVPYCIEYLILYTNINHKNYIKYHKSINIWFYFNIQLITIILFIKLIRINCWWIMNIVIISQATNILSAYSSNWWYSYYFMKIIFNADTYHRRKNHKSDNEMMIIKLMHIVESYWANDGILYITIIYILLPYYYHYYYYIY